jgi:predicted CoA-binding protein
MKQKNIAIVGLSDKKDRDSYQVAQYLQKRGYKIVPINPMIKEVLGEKAYGKISEIPASIRIDIVDIFRKPEAVIEIVKDIIKTQRKPIIWLQEGVSSPKAEKFIKKNSFELVSNLCMMKTRC